MKNIRKPAVAGTFYPANKELLKSMIEEFLENSAKPDIHGELKAIVVPHAGYIFSGIVAAAGFNLLKKLNARKKWKVLLLGPSHFTMFHGAAAPDVDGWETPLGIVTVKSILEENEKFETITKMEEVFKQEHSLEVEVPFLQMVMKKWELYLLCLGDVDSMKLAEELKDFIMQDNVIVVVSSDLSHYYSYDDARVLDDNANKFIPIKAIAEVKDRVEACGITGIITLLHLADMLGWNGYFIDYRNSGDTAGDKSQVVGYGCYAFTK